jgi:hypothetical protein
MENQDNWKITTLVIGGTIGLLVGLLAAYIIVRRAEEEETQPQVTAMDGLKIGAGVVGLMRISSDIGAKR